MPVSEKVREYLKKESIEFETQDHHIAFTSQEIAASEHVSGKAFAKVVIVFVDEKMAMLALPAAHSVDLAKAGQGIGAASVRLAAESEFSGRFSDCELGAMPPLGKLFDVPVYVDPTLAGQERIVFQGGTHATTIAMRYEDFERLTGPTVVPIQRGA